MTHILIVDDKEENLYYLRVLLTGHDCTVTSARHGAEALVKARQNPPDIVISDLLMPVMDGYTLLRHWKSDARLKMVPFIVYTATYTEAEDERLALDLGADAFILKPAEPEDFLVRLHEVQNKTASTTPTLPKEPVGDEKGLLEVYNRTLIRKLEEKTLQQEETNQALLQDIAKRKLVEEQLRANEERLNEAQHLARIGSWIWQPDGTMLWSETMFQLFGMSNDLSPTFEHFLTVVHPDDREQVKDSFQEWIVSDHISMEMEYRLHLPDGSTRMIVAIGRIERHANGPVICATGTCQDITERRKLEAQFRQAQKMEAIGQLASGVAHDFNNILGVIMMQAGLMSVEKDISSKLRDSAVEIEKAAQRAGNLTRQMLLFSRQQAMRPHDIDLNDVVTNMTKMLHRILGEDVEMQFKLSSTPLVIHADAGMIDQILLNLTVNARDAMTTGGRLVIETSTVAFDEVTAPQTPQARPGSFACVSVSDTGCGISSEILPRIFEPFFTTKDVSKGTGLGLATVFGIVNQHQGWINVSSEVGQGTIFRVYLPRLTKPSNTKTAQLSPTSVRGGSETILLIEDDSYLRSSIRHALSSLGYHVLEAASGAEALEIWKLHHDKILLLLTDLVLPGGITGRDLAEQFLQQAPKLKVIYSSGYGVEIISKHAFLKEDINFLAKPFEAAKLAQIVRNTLDKT